MHVSMQHVWSNVSLSRLSPSEAVSDSELLVFTYLAKTKFIKSIHEILYQEFSRVNQIAEFVCKHEETYCKYLRKYTSFKTNGL